MIEILHGLTGRAFSEIVEAGNDHETPAGFVQRKADIAEVRVRDVLQLGQRTRGPDSNHRPSSVRLAIERFDVVCRLRLAERNVNRGEDSASEREQMSRKNNLRLAQAGVLEDFRRVAVRKKIVSLEILIEFREMEIAARLLARSGRAGLAVADDAMFRSDPAGVN